MTLSMRGTKFNTGVASLLLRSLMLTLPIFFIGCGKAESKAAENPKKPLQSEAVAEAAKETEGQKAPVFAPTTAAPAPGTITKEVERLLDQAGQYAETYRKAASYERWALMNKIMPPLKQAVQLQDTDELRTLLRNDPRFTALAFRPEFRALVDRPPAKKMPTKLTIKDPGGLTPPAKVKQVGAEPVATVNRAGPDSVANVANTLGDAMAELAKGMHFDARVTREVERLLKLVLEKQSGDWQKSLGLLPDDSLETRIAKVQVALAYDQLLSKIVSHEGSYFLGCRTTDGGFEIWEFKQPIALSVRSEAMSERTRLNTGVLFTSELEFAGAGDDILFRRYLNGCWSSWGDFPKLPPFTVTKAENWTVERNTKTPARTFSRLDSSSYSMHVSEATIGYDSFIRLPANLIDAALLRSEESRATSALDAQQKDRSAGELNPEESLALARAKLALGYPDEALQLINQALKRPEIETQQLKDATALLADWFYCVKPTLASDFVTDQLYAYLKTSGATGNSKNDDFDEMTTDARKLPQRQTRDHRYGLYSFEVIDQLTRAHVALVEKEPENNDAQFELAEAYMMHQNFHEKAARILSEVVQKTSATGHDYKRIVASTPTFVPFLSERLGGYDDFKSILTQCGVEKLSYMKQFQKESVGYQMGY